MMRGKAQGRPNAFGGPMAFFDSTGAIARPEDYERPEWMDPMYGWSGKRLNGWGLDGNIFMNWNGEYVQPPESTQTPQAQTPQAQTPQPQAQPQAQMQPQMQQQMQQPMQQMQQPMRQQMQPQMMQPGSMPQAMGRNALMGGFAQPRQPIMPLQGYQNALLRGF